MNCLLGEAAPGATGDADTPPVDTAMKKSLRERLFGPRKTRDAGSTALKEKTLAKINEPDPGVATRQRRTIGLTEQRLRAANQQSWITSSKGWSGFFGRFTR